MGRKIRYKALKYIGPLCLVSFSALAGRLYYVETQIAKRPVTITELSISGYTPEGVYGHGDLIGENAGQGWYIYDTPAPNGKVRKVCTRNTAPDPSWDIDFIYHQDEWFKLRTGTAEISGMKLIVTPPRSEWKAGIYSRTAFPVRRPDFAYRAKNLYAKLRSETLSPLEYLQGLKTSNPNCADIPAP